LINCFVVSPVAGCIVVAMNAPMRNSISLQFYAFSKEEVQGERKLIADIGH
jgi:hypothetical protein